MSAATPHYAIPPEHGRWQALVLALAMHAALFAFLWIGIRWQSQTPVALEAEVWDLQTREAAPPPPPPEPEPVPEEKPLVREVVKPIEAPPPAVDPDIALEKIRKQKAEQARLEDELRKKQLEADKKKAEADKKQAELKAAADAKEKKRLDDKARKDKEAAEAKQIAQLRKDNMARINAGNALPGSTGTAARSTGARGDPNYLGQIVSRIKSNLSYGGDTAMPGNPQAVYKIQQLPTGEILNAILVRSSGIPAYDAAVEKAIAKSSPLPRKKDGSVEREIEATFKLKETP